MSPLFGAGLGGGGSIELNTANYQSFNASGTFTVPAGVKKVDVLCVAGGGGGGGFRSVNNYSGGGGAGGGGGGVIESLNLSVTPGAAITVTVGAGGIAAVCYNADSSGNAPTNGNNSSFGSLVATTGGGKGGHGQDAVGNGGSGGGSVNYNAFAQSGGGTGTPGSGISGQGFNGSQGGEFGPRNGVDGCGGGAGGPATAHFAIGNWNNADSYTAAGAGGPGKTSAISGTLNSYGGGGGGFGQQMRILGGAGGGGNGGWYKSFSVYGLATAGEANTGGGGGGGRANDNQGTSVAANPPRAGGSGFVAVRWYTA